MTPALRPVTGGQTDPEVMLKALTAACPVPENPFEKAFWCAYMGAACEVLCSVLHREYMITVEHLLDTGAKDDRFVLFPLTRTERLVDTEKLRRDDPEMYENLAFISATTAGKALGKKGLRAAMAAEFGEENLHLYESVNVKDVETIYDPEEWDNFIRETRIPDGYMILDKRGTEAGTEAGAEAEAGAAATGGDA